MRKYLAGATLLAAGLVVMGLSNLAAWPPTPPGPGGPRHAAHHLRHAYDDLNQVALYLRAEKGKKGEKAPREAARLADQANDLYRGAHQAYRAADYARAAELSAAAEDAARGLVHLLRATQPAAAGLPAPPVGVEGPPPPPDGKKDRGKKDKGKKDKKGPPPEEAADPAGATRDFLQRVRDRLADAAADAPRKGPGRDFLDAARRAYDQAQEALGDKDYARAIGLGRAAEAWSHVGDHLLRAAEAGGERPERVPRPAPKD
ncbi:MAG TPA: hypothetical protein VFA26_05840 [Gemmataceae bacterium]|nr:hypothetical protein [Gemmataceae bacterium]